MENTQLEEMTYIVQNTWLPIMRGQDTIGETRIGERDAIRIANNLIEANYIKQAEAEWIPSTRYHGFYMCSSCRSTNKEHQTFYRNVWSFCPHCGAKIKVGD